MSTPLTLRPRHIRHNRDMLPEAAHRFFTQVSHGEFYNEEP